MTVTLIFSFFSWPLLYSRSVHGRELFKIFHSATQFPGPTHFPAEIPGLTHFCDCSDTS